MKYIKRFRFKNGVEDLKKARVYPDRLIAWEERNEIADHLEKYASEIRDSHSPKDNLRDVILDALWYLIELSDKPVKFKLGDKYVEYLTSDTIGVTDYPEASTPYSKKDAHKVIRELIIDIDE